MKNLLVLLLLFPCVLLLSCSKTDQISAKKTVIAGKVINIGESDSQTLRVNLSDPLDESRPLFRLEDTHGTFHIAHEYVFAQNLTIGYNGTFINLFVEPGDSLYLVIDAQKTGRAKPSTDSYTLSGKGDLSFNWEIAKWIDHSYSSTGQADNNLKGDDLFEWIKQEIRTRLMMLDNYADSVSMSEKAKEWADRDTRFLIGNQLWDLGSVNAAPYVTDSIFGIYNPENLQTYLFQYHASLYTWGLMENGDENWEGLDTNLYIERAENALKVFKAIQDPVMRDFMIFMTFNLIHGESKDPEVVETLLSSYPFHYKVFGDRLKAIVYPPVLEQPVDPVLKGVLFYQNNEALELEPLALIEYLIDKHKGKSIYIDVWATWCGPCKNEMRNHVPALHSKYHDDDIVFVNICLNSDIKSWIPTMEQIGVSGENYFLNEYGSAIWLDTYNIQAFPTYRFITKTGELLPENAPRPSETAKLDEFFSNHL